MLSTIRAKLLGGFIVLTLMVVGLATYSVVKVQQSADSFTGYSDLARDVSVAGSLQSHMLITRLGAIRYLSNPTDDAVQAFSNDFKATIEDVNEAKINEADKKEKIIYRTF